MRYGSTAIVTNGSMSQSFNSIGVDTSQHWACSIQANYSGSGLGDMKIQVSNDNPAKSPIDQESDPAARVTNWATYSSSSTTGAAGSTSFIVNLANPGFRWTRFTFTASTGSGVMSVNYFGKGA